MTDWSFVLSTHFPLHGTEITSAACVLKQWDVFLFPLCDESPSHRAPSLCGSSCGTGRKAVLSPLIREARQWLTAPWFSHCVSYLVVFLVVTCLPPWVLCLILHPGFYQYKIWNSLVVSYWINQWSYLGLSRFLIDYLKTMSMSFLILILIFCSLKNTTQESISLKAN